MSSPLGDVSFHALLGGMAGVTAKSVTAPLDRVKILGQTGSSAFTLSRGLDLAREAVVSEGLVSLWRGNGIQVLRMGPYAAIGFSSQEYFRRTLTAPGEKRIGTGLGFVAGACTAVTASTVTYPLDTLRCCMATHRGQATSSWAVITAIHKQNGILGLFKGIGASTMGVIPYGSLAWGTYYILNAQLQQLFGTEEDELIWLKGTASFTSTLMAQTAVRMPSCIYS